MKARITANITDMLLMALIPPAVGVGVVVVVVVFVVVGVFVVGGVFVVVAPAVDKLSLHLKKEWLASVKS